MWGTDDSALRAAQYPYLSAIRVRSSGGIERWNIDPATVLPITATPAKAISAVAKPTMDSYSWEIGMDY